MPDVAPLGNLFDQQALVNNVARGLTDVLNGRTSTAWPQEQVLPDRWNQVWPYQLLILQFRDSGYRIVDRYTLPIPPQELQLDIQFAEVLTATLGGVADEESDIVFVPITLNGSTGVFPLRGTAATLQRFTPAQAIFAGTAPTIANLSIPPPNLVSVQDIQGDLGQTTGYAQWQFLRKFLENYAALRRADPSYRLSFATWKDSPSLVYLVAPQNLVLKRSAGSALEYPYTLTMTAWRRVPVDATGASAFVYTPTPRDPSAMATMLNNLNQARSLAETGRNVLGSVVDDVNRALFEPLRETVLFAKDILGVGITAADLPATIIKSMAGSILQVGTNFASFGAGVSQLSGANAQFDQTVRTAQDQIKDLGVQLGLAQVNGVGQTGTTAQALQTQSGTGSGLATTAHPGAQILLNPQDNFGFFSTISPDNLNLPPEVNAAIDTEVQRVRRLGRQDFEDRLNTVQETLYHLSETLGAGDPTFTATYGRPPVTTSRTPTDTDFEILYAINAVCMELAKLAGTTATDAVNQDQPTPMEYVAGLAQAQGIDFRVARSKFAIPFPYGVTLERLAERYLGDASRWGEIATLNELQEPYVDEVGFDIPLVATGEGTQVVVADATNLHLGQAVWVQSNTQAPQKRHVVNIEALEAGQVLITLDGAATLASYTLGDAASLHTYLPGTVNSLQIIYIPSDQDPANPDLEALGVPGIQDLDGLLTVGGVDLLLTQSGDLIVTPDGDSRWATGLANLVQGVHLAIGTPTGALLLHPEWGFAIRPGTSLADFTAKDTLVALRNTFRYDPDIVDISAASVQIRAPVASIAAALTVRGVSNLLPVATEVPLRS